jgi:hypothetical protein
MRYLKDVFILIWGLVNGKDSVYDEENIFNIMKYIKSMFKIKQKVFFSGD